MVRDVRLRQPHEHEGVPPARGRRLVELRGELVTLRPVAEADATTLRAIAAAPEVVRWWGEQDDDFPFDEPESTRFAILEDDRVVGLVQYGEEPEEDYRHAWIDVFVDPRRHGRGLGTDAVRRLAQHLHEDRGHHRVTIDPAAANEVAVRSYEKAGFRPVGVMRRAWRGPDGVWQDVLLMEIVTD
jgi:aminoglycoside 6'-N-acetyltransferase